LKKLITAIATATLALSVFVPVAGASPAPQPTVFTGRTASQAETDSEFVYPFTVPTNHSFRVSWTSSPYPPGAREKSRYFGLKVGQYSDVNNFACWDPTVWCGTPTVYPPVLANGIHTFISTGNGHFTVGVLAITTQWVIKVVGDLAQPPVAGAAPVFHQVARDTAVGQGADAQILVTFGPATYNGVSLGTKGPIPSKMEVVVTSTPRQAGRVQWLFTCNENGGGSATTAGGVNRRFPVTVPLPPMPAPTAVDFDCVVEVDASLGASYNGSGSVTIRLEVA
jgi:hypothetical protein